MPHSNPQLVRAALSELFLARSDFAHHFYDRLFARAPEARAHFVHDMAHQEKVLFSVMTMLVSSLSGGRDLEGELFDLGRMHARAGIGQAHFAPFGAAFLETMLAFLPDRDPVALSLAWAELWDDISAGVKRGVAFGEDELREEKRVFYPFPRAPAISARRAPIARRDA